MKKPNNQFLVCKGINSAISILSSGRYDVNHVDILKCGRAFKDDSIKPFGLGYQTKSVLSLPIISILVGILSYMFGLYYLYYILDSLL